MVFPSATFAETVFWLIMVLLDIPAPMVDPMERLTPPARAASLLWSTASITMFPPSISAFTSVAVFDFVLIRLTAIPADAVPSYPDTAPDTDCAASWLMNSSSRFCTRLLRMATSPAAFRLPFTATVASFLLSDTAAAPAMELDFSKRDMEAEVPTVAELALLSAVMPAGPPVVTISPSTSVPAECFACVRPTAAAISYLLP